MDKRDINTMTWKDTCDILLSKYRPLNKRIYSTVKLKFYILTKTALNSLNQ